MLRSIKGKVAAIYISLVAVIAILGFISIFYMNQISQTIDGLIAANYNSIQRLNIEKEALGRQDNIIFSYLYAGKKQNIEGLFSQAADQFYEQYNEEKAVVVIPNEVEIVGKIDRYYREYIRMFGVLISDFDTESQEGLQKARVYYETVMKPQYDLVGNELIKLYNCNESALFEKRDDAARTARNEAYVLFILFGLSAIMGLWLSATYTRRFLRPLYEITQTIRSVGRGNMNRKTNISTQDEFGILADEFNNMTQRLGEFEKSTMGSLLDERNRTIAIVRSITEPIIVLDSQYHVVIMSESFEKMFSISLKETSGQPFEKVIDNSKMAEYMAGIDYRIHEFRDILATAKDDEKVKYFNITLTPISDNSGLIIALHDITEMKLLDKAKSDFVATVSHEFKTPLTSIVMGADLLANKSLGPVNGEQQEIIDVIKEDSKRLSDLVYNLLELSKIESSLTIYHFEKCDIMKIIAKSVKQFSYLAEKSGVSLTVAPVETLPLVNADKTKISWVINNLLSNAVKYTKAGDRIIIHALFDSGKVQVSVSDTGTGISPEMLEHIFERYVQIKSYDIDMRGSGIGLALSKEIIAAHGGELWCSSREGAGSTFTFSLKIMDNPSKRKEEAAG